MPTTVSDAPVVGAMALHLGNQLDARPVAAVSPDGRRIRLQIGSLATTWLPARNYTYTIPKD